MKKGQKNEHGGALLVTLAVMIMLTIAAIMAVNTAQTDMDLSFNRLHSDQAFYVAEAGLMTAFAQLNTDNSWNAGYSNESFESGTFSVAVIDSFVDVNLFDTIILRAAGSISDANANLEALVVPEYWRPFQYAVYADISLSMDNNTCTDSYNSDSADYDTEHDVTAGDVASNGTLDFDHTATVGGDASSALDGGITACANCTIHGDTATNIEPYTFPTIPDSVYDWAQINTEAPGGLSGDYSYDGGTYDLSMAINDSMVMSGGAYYFSNITIGNNSQIAIPTGDTVIIYLDGDITIGQNTAINIDGEPGNLIIFSRGSSFVMGESVEIKAAFYGLSVDVSLANSCEYFGSIVSNSTTAINMACVHYDQSLRIYECGKTGNMLMLAWKEL